MYQNKTKNNSFFWYAVPAVIIFTIFYLIRGTTFEDDAYIFYRYAANWAAGYGPVFNIGEYVEGYSSFLWTAILTIGILFSLNPVNLAPLLNLFIVIGCLFLISYICSLIQFSRPHLMAVVLTLFYALSHGVFYYGASGMDTLLFSLVLLLCIISLYKSKESENYLIALPFLVLLNLVRAEGFVYSIVLLAVLTCFVTMENKRIPKQLFATILAFAGLTIVLFIVRYSIYNEWIPATVSAKGYATYSIKTALFNGDYQAMKNFIRVILNGLRYEAFLFFLGAWIPFIVLLRNKSKDDILLWLIAFSVVVNVAVSVWAGGDYFPFKRHIIPVLPVLIVFVAWAGDLLLCKYWNGLLHRKVALSAAAILILFLWGGVFIKPAIIPPKELKGFKELLSKRSLYLRQIGTILHDIPVSTTLLSNMIGKISYYAGLHVYVRDILGLTDIHNAKYGDAWGLIEGGGGVCGRTDYTYSFINPFDIFVYNSPNMHKKFISFCQENTSLCRNYRFFKSAKWPKAYFYIIANITHPISAALEERFNAVPIPINEDPMEVIQLN